jgi:hypothetical protein
MLIGTVPTRAILAVRRWLARLGLLLLPQSLTLLKMCCSLIFYFYFL